MTYLLGWRKYWAVQGNCNWSIILNHNIHVCPKHPTCVKQFFAVGVGLHMLHSPFTASGLYCWPNCVRN